MEQSKQNKEWLWEMFGDILDEHDAFRDLNNIRKRWAADPTSIQQDLNNKHVVAEIEWCIATLRQLIKTEPFITDYAFIQKEAIEFEQVLETLLNNINTQLKTNNPAESTSDPNSIEEDNIM